MSAQGTDPNLLREIEAVRAEVARSLAALRQYTWTEDTEISLKGEKKSSKTVQCRADGCAAPDTPAPKEKQSKGAVSNRVVVRSKADEKDYMERAVTLIRNYVPPKPEQIDYMARNGYAVLGRSSDGKSEVRFRDYFQRGDSVVFTYDPSSKVLQRVTVVSYLGTPKDKNKNPVTLEATFEALPDGVNHLSAATLNASAKKFQVKTRNILYQKMSN